jgi:uncharacterized membrane protein YhhN
VARGDKRQEYITKPLAIVLLIAAAAYFLTEGVSDRQGWWTIAALSFSLAGDVFLMLELDYFLPGLASFFVAHVCYLVAFGPWEPDFAIDYMVIGLLVVVGGTLYLRFLKGMREKGKIELAVPVAAYVVAISAMVYAAWSLGDQSPDLPNRATVIPIPTIFGNEDPLGRSSWWPLSPRNTATIGAVLFMLSDALIGWTRFVADFARSKVAIHVTYHLAQILLVLSLVA